MLLIILAGVIIMYLYCKHLIINDLSISKTKKFSLYAILGLFCFISFYVTLFIGNGIIILLNKDSVASVINYYLISGSTEELVKLTAGLLIYFIILKLIAHDNSVQKVILLGKSILISAIGFAVFENTIYLINNFNNTYSKSLHILSSDNIKAMVSTFVMFIMRYGVSLSTHVVSSIVVFLVYKASIDNKNNRVISVILGLIVGTLVHASFNIIIELDLGKMFLLVYLVFGIMIILSSLEKKILYRY